MKPKSPPKPKLGTPIPVRYKPDEEKALREINRRTGLPISQIGRLAARYVLPKVLSGEISINELVGFDEAKQPA